MKRNLIVIIAAVIALSLVSRSESQKKKPQPKGGKLPPGTLAYRNLEYVKGGHERHRLDLYLPKDAKGPLPVVIWVHGGGWRNGSKENCRGRWLVTKGYAVASINYRLSQHAIFPAQIEDCKAAIRWLRANGKKYKLDTKRFGVWGSSAGGHLVALLGTSGDVKELEGDGGNLDLSSRVQAVVDWYGPTDFTKMNGQSGAKGKIDHDAPNSPESRLIGGPVQQNKAKAAKASPLRYVSKDDPPFLIIHGTEDPLVAFGQSELLHAGLKKAGVESTLVPLKGAGHGGRQFNTPEIRRLIEEFFDRHLKNHGRM